VRRVGLAELGRDGGGDGRQAGRVEPDVRVLALQVGGLGGLLGGGVEGGHQRQHIDGFALGLLLDGLVHFGLQALEIDDDLGLGDLGHLLRRELQVVRLRAGRGEVGDADGVAADALGDELQRVEGGDDGELALLAGSGVIGSAGGQGARGQDGGRADGGGAKEVTASHGTPVSSR
jgi:hypothetical protein